MRPEFMDMLRKLCIDGSDATDRKRMRDLISFYNDKNLNLTIKDYKQHPAGLSHFIHKDIFGGTNSYEIKGLLGKGLDVKTSGHHIGFAAGTGILVFLDLVAHLLLRILSEELGDNVADFFESHRIDLANFHFTLNVSFESEDEAIGVELLRLLREKT